MHTDYTYFVFSHNVVGIRVDFLRSSNGKDVLLIMQFKILSCASKNKLQIGCFQHGFGSFSGAGKH